MNKVVSGPEAAVARIKDGSRILVGGFGVCGIPENLLAALRAAGTKNITIVSNNAGLDTIGIGLLLNNGQVKKMILSYGGECKAFEEMTLSGKLEVEWTPQGTLAEKIRAGGAGIPAFYTPTGYGTIVAQGKETREFNGRHYVMETALRGDFALIKAWRGDKFGNLQFRKTARNFNQVMATAADCVIAEVEELVEPGQIDPNAVHTPGVYVDMILKGAKYLKPIEKLTLTKAPAHA